MINYLLSFQIFFICLLDFLLFLEKENFTYVCNFKEIRSRKEENSLLI